MKLNKLIALLLAVAMLFAFVGCPTGNEPAVPGDNSGNNIPAEDPLKDVADIKDGLIDAVVDATDPENPVEVSPAVKAYKITDVEGLVKLAELVNGKAASGTEGAEDYVAAVEANTLAGYTFSLANDITINESVLKAGFLEPDEGEGATANAALVNLASIGMRGKGFAGTFDGNGKVIKGLYMYQANQGLGFIGATAEGAVIKNVTLIDACVVNCNASAAEDGSDDDRFGGLIGLVEGATTIENCVFIGVVGSSAAAGRGKTEYVGGLVGRVDAATTAKDCTVLARVYAEQAGDVINSKGKDNLTLENVIGLDASNPSAIVYEGNNEYVKAAIEFINTPAPDPEPEPTPDPDPETPADASKVLQVTTTYKTDSRYQFIIDGFEVKNGDALNVVITYPEATVSEPLLRSVASSSYTKFRPTTAAPITDLLVELSATATEDSAGLMITLNGTFGADVMPIYILSLSVNDTEIPLESITSVNGGEYVAGLEMVELAE